MRKEAAPATKIPSSLLSLHSRTTNYVLGAYSIHLVVHYFLEFFPFNDQKVVRSSSQYYFDCFLFKYVRVYFLM